MMSRSDSPYYLAPNEQDLLVAALSSNQPSTGNKMTSKNSVSRPNGKGNNGDKTSAGQIEQGTLADDYFDQLAVSTVDSDLVFNADDVGFDHDGEGDEQFDFESNGPYNGDFPGDVSPGDPNDLHDKRKSVGDGDDDEDGGGKRREGEVGASKKPGRKPLTAEPTTKRKAQNRAAQRAFRERKEKHLKDLETKVDDLEKASETTNHENGLLRAQNERLKIELKEYRKRLSWIGSNGQSSSASLGSSAPGAAARKSLSANGSDFQFEFPRFGDLPANHLFNASATTSTNGQVNSPTRSSTLPAKPNSFGPPGGVGRQSVSSSSPTVPAPNYLSTNNSPLNASNASPSIRSNQTFPSTSTFDSFSGLFSPSIIEASRQASSGYFPQSTANSSNQTSRKNSDQNGPATNFRQYSNSSLSNTNSPASSYESQQNGSSIGTSPEPSLSSPAQRVIDYGLKTINENHPQNNFGGTGIPSGLDPNSFNWLVQQNGGGFDPVLFGDYRESQDAVASQDFGAFFNDAFPSQEFESPEQDYHEVPLTSSAKPNLIAQAEAAQEGKQELASTEDTSKLVPCNKIWDRLQSMEEFRNREIDMDSLCSDLKAKARCTEGGAVVHQKDLDRILRSAR